jgi:hypothetical protein
MNDISNKPNNLFVILRVQVWRGTLKLIREAGVGESLAGKAEIVSRCPSDNKKREKEKRSADVIYPTGIIVDVNVKR